MTHGRWIPFWVFISLAMAAGQAVYAEVWVRSTVRDGTNRLILHFDEVPQWRVERGSGMEVHLHLDPAPESYRIDNVSGRMPGTRIRTITPDPQGSGLVLALNCTCELDISTIAGRLLMVDIRAPELANTPAPMDMISLSSLSPKLVMSHTQEAAPDVSPAPASPTLPLVTQSMERPPWFDLPVSPASGSMEDTMSRALSQEIARAASAGLVDPDRDIEGKSDGARSQDGPITTTSDIDALIRLRTGLDRAFSSEETPLPQIAPQLSCPASGDFDLLTWGQDKEPFLQIGRARQDLLGEFDQLDEAAALAYVKLLIYLTFDYEAQNFIHRMMPDHPQGEFLAGMAGVIGRFEPNQNIAQLAECGGSLPLVAFLAAEPQGLADPPKRDALLLTYSALPAFLRRHFAPALAERFSALGDQASVDTVLAAVERVTPSSDPSVIIANGKAAEGELGDETKAALRDLATSLRPEAGEALRLNIEDRLANGERIPRDLIDTAGILAFEQASGEMGPRFRYLQIKALLANGAFTDGFNELNQAEGQSSIEPEDAKTLWQFGIENLYRMADDPEFVRHMFEPGITAHVPKLSTDLRRQMAERLLRAGFPTQGQEIWGGDASDDPVFAARLAAGALDLERAFELTRSVRSREAQTILAEALTRSGQYGEAFEVLSAFSDEPLLTEGAWRAGNWGVVGESGVGAFGAAARAMAELENAPGMPPAAPDMSTLDGSRALIDSSLELRETIQSLLDATPLQDGES